MPSAKITPESVIVLPCFNEEKRLDRESFLEFAAAHPDCLMLFVNDGSTDQTSARLEEIRNAAPDRVEILNLPENRGKAEAVRRGFLLAFEVDPKFIGFWDSDLATPLKHIDTMINILKANLPVEMVFSTRSPNFSEKIERAFYRHALGNFFAYVCSLFFRLPVYDTQCGAKIFRNSPELRHAFEKPFLTKWLFDIEIYARLAAQDHTGSIISKVHDYSLPFWKDINGSKLQWKDYLISAMQFLKLYRAYPVLHANSRKKLT